MNPGPAADSAQAAAADTTGAAFKLHWSRVPNPPSDPVPGLQVHALWPSPVNPDVCFEAAGFTDFGDADNAWDAQASALLQRVLDGMALHFGAAQLHHQPLMSAPPGYRRLFTLNSRPTALPLLDQLALPMHNDSLPTADIRFGNSGARIRAGAGHWLLWVDWPSHAPTTFEAFVHAVAAGFPVFHTDLDWSALWRA